VSQTCRKTGEAKDDAGKTLNHRYPQANNYNNLESRLLLLCCLSGRIIVSSLKAAGMRETRAGSSKKLIRTLRGEVDAVPPIWMMRQAGRYLPEYREIRARAGSFLDLCYSPELACEVTLQPIRRYGFDAAILFADILLVPHALGQNVEFREGEGPVLEKIGDGRALAALSMDGLHEVLAPVYETVSRVRAGLGGETALIGFCGAPWTVATYMVGGRGSSDQREARLAAYGEAWFASLIDLLVEASVEYLCAQIEAGAEVVQVFDTWAGNLPASEFERWCVTPVADLVARVKSRHQDVPVIGFPRGCGSGYAAFAELTGVEGVGLDSAVDPAWAARSIDRAVVLQGNLDPLAVVAGGRALRDGVAAIESAFAERAHIFNLGHGLVPETPPEHVADVVALVRSGAGG
jgi:uroporphyrinogen decarboxylase